MNLSGIAWIEEYRKQPRLTLSEETATGFASTLEAANALGATNAFELKNNQVVDSLFLGPAPQAETVHIFYFSGHGSERGPLLSDGRTRSTYSTMGLGAGHLTYAVFDCCKMLDPSFGGRWRGAFEGLHYLLGFARSVGQDKKRGQRFAEFLVRGFTIPDAWKMAALETGGAKMPWACLRAVTDGTFAPEETWSNSLPLDPAHPLVFVHRHDRIERDMPAPPSPQADRVLLFRTERLEWTDTRKERLARRLDLAPGWEAKSHNGWSELWNPYEWVELYPASGSFWMRREPFPEAKANIFREAARPPSLDQAVARSHRFLAENGLLDRISLDSVTATVERVEEVEKAGRELSHSMDRVISRHTSFSFKLHNLPVLGPGAKLRVSLEAGEMNEFLCFWREPVSSGRTTPVITAAEARRILLDSEGFRDLEGGKLTLSEGRLGYYALPPREEQGYLVPVYEFTGNYTADSEREDQEGNFSYDFTRYVQAVRPEDRPQGSDAAVFEKLDTVFP